ncbi:MAG: ArsR/SmtB family transcription factor [Acidimicrobiia bacterium]
MTAVPDAGSALQILGDPTRRAILEALAAQPLAVGELARRLPISRPAVSQHLGALKAAGLVQDRAEGTRRIYRVDPAGLELLRTYLDRMWAQVLANLQDGLSTGPEPAAPPNPSEPNEGNPT